MAVPAAGQWAEDGVVGVGGVHCWQLAQIGIFAFVKPVKSPQPVPSASAPSPQHPALDIQNVIAAHLFGVAAVNGGAQDPENAPQSSANLLLAGTIATQDPKRGVAIISDGGGPSKVYSVGDRVGGASLHSVYLDHVILDRGGALETLQLPRQLLPATADPRRQCVAQAATRAPLPRSTTFGKWCSRTRAFSIR